jgi:hypothetical protein
MNEQITKVLNQSKNYKDLLVEMAQQAVTNRIIKILNDPANKGAVVAITRTQTKYFSIRKHSTLNDEQLKTSAREGQGMKDAEVYIFYRGNVNMYVDKNGKEIKNGMKIQHKDGDIEEVLGCGDELGVNASNKTFFELHPDTDMSSNEIYPLHQFNLSEWEIISQEKGGKEVDEHGKECPTQTVPQNRTLSKRELSENQDKEPG